MNLTWRILFVGINNKMSRGECMKQKIFYVFVLAALILSACGNLAGGQPVVARVGWAGSPDTVNPGTAILTEAFTIFGLVYDAMYKLNLDGTFSLGVAESVEHSDDGLVYTYKIRDGIKFHDGQPLTAKDIKFSYDLYKTHDDFPYINAYTNSYSGT